MTWAEFPYFPVLPVPWYVLVIPARLSLIDHEPLKAQHTRESEAAPPTTSLSEFSHSLAGFSGQYKVELWQFA